MFIITRTVPAFDLVVFSLDCPQLHCYSTHHMTCLRGYIFLDRFHVIVSSFAPEHGFIMLIEEGDWQPFDSSDAKAGTNQMAGGCCGDFMAPHFLFLAQAYHIWRMAVGKCSI